MTEDFFFDLESTDDSFQEMEVQVFSVDNYWRAYEGQA